MAALLWGIDLGGTKVEGVVLRTSSASDTDAAPQTLTRQRILTEAELGYSHIVRRVAHLVDELEQETGLSRSRVIGIGTPGARRPDGTMKNCNTTSLNGQPLAADLAAALGTEVRLANDADCFALAEATMGVGRGHRTVFGVIMGTGVGGGLVVDGRLLQGPNGLTGEWGHTPLVTDGLPCYCGRRGCVETYLSGPAVERRHFETYGVRTPLQQIVTQSDSDPNCMETIAWMCGCFGRALSLVVNTVDPDVVVLGGGAGQVPQLRTLGLEHLRANVFGPDFVTPVVAPELGDSAGVFGAALLSCDR